MIYFQCTLFFRDEFYMQPTDMETVSHASNWGVR